MEIKNTNNGIINVQVKNIHEFNIFCQNHLFLQQGIYYRGQRDSSWELNTSLDRFINKLDKRCTGTADSLYKDFLQSIRGRSAVAKGLDNEEEVWALGQHNGLPTPLLDWTRAAYIALYFAFEDESPSTTGLRSVYALHKYVKTEMENFNKNKEFMDKFYFLDPLTDHNTRLLSQAGLFTKQPINFQLQNWIEERWAGINDKPVFFKINIPDDNRLSILEFLFNMNITPETIYPDLSGSAKYSALKLQILSERVSKMNDKQLREHSTYKKIAV